MNEVETGRFLAAVIALDPRMPQPDSGGFMRRLWARQLADVPAEAADRAMMTYYRSERYRAHRDTISPADVVQWWHAHRRPTAAERHGNAQRSLARPPFNAGQIRGGIDRCVAALAEAKAVRAGDEPVEAADTAHGEAAARRLVRANPCPHCKATAGSPCLRLGARLDQPIRLHGYHRSRIDLAQDCAA